MLVNEYQKLASRTECDQMASRRRMHNGRQVQANEPDTTPIRLNHSVIGLAGEVGELASLIQKWIYYGKQYDPEELKKQFMLEFGDALWYIAEGLNALGLDMNDVMEANIAKLQTRYPEKYTDHHAQEENRNRVEEEKAIEGIKPLIAPTPKVFKGVETKCKHCSGTGKIEVSDGEGGSGPTVCGMCSGRGIVWNREIGKPKPFKSFAAMLHGDPRPRPDDHPNPFGYNDPIPGVDPKSVDGEEDIHQIKEPTVGIGRFQEPPPYHMGRNPPEVTTVMSWEQKLLAEPLKPNGCEKCHGSGYHRYPDFLDGTPNFSNSAPCSYCDGKGVKG